MTDTKRFLLIGLLLSFGAQAHHAYTEFDQRQIVEIEGTLKSARWVNPHAALEIEVRDENDRLVTWEIEAPGLNRFQRFGIPLDIFAVGTTVKLAGWPSRRSATRMYGHNILSEDGREAVLWQEQARWTDQAYGLERTDLVQAEEVRSTPSLFRVWSSGVERPGLADDPDASPGSLSRVPLPLTDAARRAAASFDPATDITATGQGCTPKGMPRIMGQPFPIEFTDQSDVIVIHLEEYDTVRTIHMGSDVPNQADSLLGLSVGRWEGNTLVVSTTRLSPQTLTGRGVPLSSSASLLERFTPSDDGSRLQYSLTITDPDSLTMPVEQNRSWLAIDGAQVLPYECNER